MDASTYTIEIPGTLTASVRDGRIIGWTFMPSAGYAGYGGPAAIVVDDEDDEDVGELNVESTDGPFWDAVRANLAEANPMQVTWEE